MNEDIKEMIFAYRNTFTASVWNGTNKIIWPGDGNSARHIHWRKRMELIRKDIGREICGLEEINKLNDEKMKEIKGLRDNLFSGTSVLESRRSVQQQAITVIQGNNIKILTSVTIFFLPLTFVTSVFGMTNMDPHEHFVRFWYRDNSHLPAYVYAYRVIEYRKGVRILDAKNTLILHLHLLEVPLGAVPYACRGQAKLVITVPKQT